MICHLRVLKLLVKIPYPNMINVVGLEINTNENLPDPLFHQEKNTKSKGYAGVHKIGTGSEEKWCASAL